MTIMIVIWLSIIIALLSAVLYVLNVILDRIPPRRHNRFLVVEIEGDDERIPITMSATKSTKGQI